MNEFNESEIKKHFSSEHTAPLYVFETIDSTNRLALEMASDGAPDGTTVAAASQTAGRGRLGRSFYSPVGSGVYISSIFRPRTDEAEDVLFLTVAAAVAVCRAIESMTDERPLIKWVNDIYMRDRKVCGILVQGIAGKNGIEHAVVGIGINLLPPERGFPDNIADIAGSVFRRREYDARAELTAKVIENLRSLCRLPIGKDVIDEYRSRSWLDGASADIIQNGSATPVKVICIDDNCRLKVMYGDGTEGVISAGEVSVRRKIP